MTVLDTLVTLAGDIPPDMVNRLLVLSEMPSNPSPLGCEGLSNSWVEVLQIDENGAAEAKIPEEIQATIHRYRHLSMKIRLRRKNHLKTTRRGLVSAFRAFPI